MDKVRQHLYMKAVHCVKWRRSCAFGYSKLIDEYGPLEVEMELDDVLRDSLTGEYGRVVAEINA